MIEYITANPEQIVRLSVADLADLAGISDATIVRTCQKMGFSGYYELKLALAQNIANPLETTYQMVKKGDDPRTIMDKVFSNAINTLKYTLCTANNESDISRAATEISMASRVCVFAFGNSSAIAFDLQHKLLRVGIDSSCYTDPHMQIIAASYLTYKDLVFAISHSGSSKDLVESVLVAKNHGSKVVSLTNIGNSPLSRVADIHLHTASEETNYLIFAQSSRIAQLAIIDTIYSIITADSNGSNEYHLLEALKSRKF